MTNLFPLFGVKIKMIVPNHSEFLRAPSVNVTPLVLLQVKNVFTSVEAVTSGLKFFLGRIVNLVSF